MAIEPLLGAAGHAASGSIGTAISTAVLYPLDLATTRLKAQRREPDQEQDNGVLITMKNVMRQEGGALALFNGVGPDVAKSIVDSFLFFGLENYLRKTSSKEPGIFKELARGAIAGACAKFCTTPLSNVVTRRQLESGRDSMGGTLKSLMNQGGFVGLWSGYSATVILTLNPSITFLINRRLAKKILSAFEEEDVPIAWIAFFIAALSKAVATVLTFPFQTGKTRLQLNGNDMEKGDADSKIDGDEARKKKEEIQRVRRTSWILALLNKSVWGAMLRTARTEGVLALYNGLQGELLKSFFSHGLTMLSKGFIHRLILRIWHAQRHRIRQSLQIKQG